MVEPVQVVPARPVIIGDNVGGTLLGLLQWVLSCIAFGACVCWGWHFAEWVLAKA